MAHHFFTAPENVNGAHVALVGDEAHHAARVLRVRPGETISVGDGSGRVLDAVVTRVSGETVEARVILVRDQSVVRPELILCQAVAKGDRMDLVIQKAVELGARRIVPFMAKRTIVHWDSQKKDRAHQRWTSIALSAAKQCRSPWRTSVDAVASGVEKLPQAGEVVLTLHEKAQTQLRHALPAQPPPSLAVVVGPEGGLEDDEVRLLEAGGARTVCLGQRVLRTETAGPVALALVSFAYGSLG